MINLILLGFFLEASVFNSAEDKEIAIAVVSSFAKQCSYIASVEQNIVSRMEQMYRQAQEGLNNSAEQCYRNHITSISSINFVYKNICDEARSDIIAEDSNLRRIFVSVQKYRRGIRFEHNMLNNCLLQNEADSAFLVDLDFNRVETDYLKKKLRKLEAPSLFKSNRTTFR